MNPSRMIKAKKSFGQHFLTSEPIAQRIAESLQETAHYKKVLEVGPGKGILTKFLLDKPYELVAVEADADMVTYLKQFFPSLDGRVVEADFLKLRLNEVMGEEPFGLIGNFPYNISSQILFKMIDYRAQIPELVGMFQREMADRVIAPPGSKTYGVISVLVQAFYKGAHLFSVKPGSFSPPPKVQSSVIRLVRKDPYTLDCDERLFRRIVKQAFNQRRKMLRNTLKPLFPDEILKEEYFQQRPEVLSVDDFVQLTKRIEALNSIE
ncbi:MAG: 16S rRNA (adenine(1518)-N(6)/adenine(1519)-N(6))-dimethyltransferase RsmA [Saprospirales bacterium]|nr:16S rRNA (adenine(1518)-N(6)/adenine(1519)-N(6))-dimethyltransferase RsmA [Saprospirales bacterium]